MKKILLCLFMALFILSSLCLFAFATDETSSVEYADWFSSQEMTGYTLTIADKGSYYHGTTAFENWLVAVGATSRDTAVGSFTLGTNNGIITGPVYKTGSYVVIPTTNDDNVGHDNGYLRSGTATIDSLDGYDLAQTIEGATITPVYSTGEGFVSSGFLSSLGIVGSVLGFILGSPLLALVGLSVGVFLIGWGITSVKDLIKGY